MSSGIPKIGIVVIGKDEGERLKVCLGSIPEGVPIVYVDSGSQDGSVSFAQSIGAQVVELDRDQPFTAARARNEGFRELVLAIPDLELVQFIDGDCELESNWLKTGEAFLLERTGYAAVCGRRRERFPDASFYNRMCDEEWNTPIGDAQACGGDALYRVSAFGAIGGFDPSIIAGEEPELCVRLRGAGWRIHRLDAPMTVHDANMMHVSQWWMRSVRCGFGYAQVWRKTRAGGAQSIYGRQIASALFWTVGVTAFALIAAIWTSLWALIAGPAIWMVQLTRLGMRVGWRKGAHLLVGKLAEALGAARYALMVLRGREQGAILYK